MQVEGFHDGLLIAFEAAVGVLVLMGGRKAQLGMVAILGMHACLLLFGWILTASGAFMLVAVGLVLRAQVLYDRTAKKTGRAASRQPDDSVAAQASQSRAQSSGVL